MIAIGGAECGHPLKENKPYSYMGLTVFQPAWSNRVKTDSYLIVCRCVKHDAVIILKDLLFYVTASVFKKVQTTLAECWQQNSNIE